MIASPKRVYPHYPTDYYGKVLRVGDTVHRLMDKRHVKKKVPNGRVLAPLGARRVKAIHIERDEQAEGKPVTSVSIQLRGKRTFCPPSSLVKE